MHQTPTTRKVFLFCLVSLATLVFNAASAQDTTWYKVEVSPDITVDMPGPTIDYDTMNIRMVAAQYDGYFFQLKKVKIKYVVKSGDELIQAYESFLYGGLRSSPLNKYANTTSDTLLNGILGEWIHSRYAIDTVYQEMYTYVVLANNYFYVVVAGATHPITPADPVVRRYFTSIKFPQTPREYTGNFPLQARSYRNGEHIGRFINASLPYVLVAGLAILCLIFVRRYYRRRAGVSAKQSVNSSRTASK